MDKGYQYVLLRQYKNAGQGLKGVISNINQMASPMKGKAKLTLQNSLDDICSRTAEIVLKFDSLTGNISMAISNCKAK